MKKKYQFFIWIVFQALMIESVFSQKSVELAQETDTSTEVFPPILHYNNFPTFTNSPEAIRKRQIYEEIILNGNYLDELFDEYYDLPNRSSSKIRSPDFRVEFDKEIIESLKDDALEELWSKPQNRVDRSKFLEDKNYSKINLIMKREGNTRIYDYLHYYLGGDVELAAYEFSLTKQGTFKVRVRSSDSSFLNKIKSVPFVLSVKDVTPPPMQPF